MFWYESGAKKASGSYTEGKKHGKWVTWYPLSFEEGKTASVKSSGTYQRGIKVGPWIEQEETSTRWGYPTVHRSTGSYRHGKRHGPWEIRNVKHKLLARGPYLMGERHGQWTRWHENGKKYEENFFRRGMLTGWIKRWDEQGALLSQVQLHGGDGRFIQRGESGVIEIDGRLKTGKRHGRWRWAESGYLEVEGHSLAGLKHGRWTSWHESGRKMKQGTYRSDRQVGTWREWDIEGKLTARYTFKDGELEGNYTWWNETRVPMTGRYRAGLKEGQWEHLFLEFSIFGGRYIADRKTGWWTNECEEGSSLGEYENNVPHGFWLIWMNAKVMGRFVGMGRYYRGRKTGLWVLALGYHLERGHYRDGQREGRWFRVPYGAVAPQGASLEVVQTTYRAGKVLSRHALTPREAAALDLAAHPQRSFQDFIVHLDRALSSESVDIRLATVHSLRWFSLSAEIKRLFFRGMGDRSSVVRKAALDQVAIHAEHGPEQTWATMRLHEMVKDRDAEVRVDAINALRNLKPAASSVEKK